MSTFMLKILACLFMLIDHVGAIFYPGIIYFRLIGRLSFPIFAFLIARGYIYSHNLKKYALRLLILAFISQIPFYYVFKNINLNLGFNIFFTLFLGLIAIYLYDKFDSYFLVLLIFILAQFFNVDYGWYGVTLIFIFYKFRDNFLAALKAMIILNVIYILYIYLYCFVNYSLIPLPSIKLYNQVFSVAALPIIYFYNNKKGLNIKYFFYIFYPLHLAVIYLINIY